MDQLDVFVIGASAGGIDPLLEIVAGLPVDLPAAVLIVVHTAADSDGHLPKILNRVSRLPIAFAVDGERIERSKVYLAPADLHMLVTPKGISLNRGPRENGFRPAIDPLFRTAARVFGRRVTGIVLSGALDDGTYGLQLIKAAGGAAVVQDPEEAQVAAMPLSALRHVAIDHVLTAAAIAALMVERTVVPARGRIAMASNDSDPQRTVAADMTTVAEMQSEFGAPSALTCPDCGGALWEITEGKVSRFRCHVGHQYLANGLDASQRDQIEEALWTATRVLEEHAELRRRLAKRAEDAGLDAVASGLDASAATAHLQAAAIRDLLIAGTPPQVDAATTTAPKTSGRSPAKPRLRAPRKAARNGKRRSR